MQPVSPSLPSATISLHTKARPKAPRLTRRWGAFAHLLLVAIGSAFALAPPVEGVILIAPLLPGDPAASVGWARTAGALLIAPGPYAGSYVVKGSLAALLLPALSHGTLLIDARFAGCGATNFKDR